MRQRYLAFVLGGAVLLGGVLVACGGSDSGGPSGVACTGNSPDLTGTWTLDTLEFVGQGAPLYPPDATGSFVFTGDSVYVTLTVPNPSAPPPTIDITGAGKCTLTATQLNINGSGLIGQASGTYTFIDAATDTLHASLVSTGQTIRVVVTR
jgi:hypothetical protein